MGWSYTTTQLFVGLFGMMEHTSILIPSAHVVVCVLLENDVGRWSSSFFDPEQTLFTRIPFHFRLKGLPLNVAVAQKLTVVTEYLWSLLTGKGGGQPNL